MNTLKFKVYSNLSKNIQIRWITTHCICGPLISKAAKVIGQTNNLINSIVTLNIYFQILCSQWQHGAHRRHYWVLSLVMFCSCLFLWHFPFSFSFRNELDWNLGTDLALPEHCTSFMAVLVWFGPWKLPSIVHALHTILIRMDVMSTSWRLFEPSWKVKGTRQRCCDSNTVAWIGNKPKLNLHKC